MISFSRVFRFGALTATAALTASSFAIIATNTNSTPIDTSYSFVGRVNDLSGNIVGSGVVVGPHQILTARHVATYGNIAQRVFSLDGTTYHPTSLSAAPDYSGGGQIDLSIITVSETFSGYYQIGSAPTVGSTITMVGYGQSGGVATTASNAGVGSTVSAAAGSYYATTVASGTRHKGDNTLDMVDYPLGGGIGPVMVSYLDGAGEAALATNDSGGGWFQNGKLIGISNFVFNDTQPDNIDLAKYHDFGFASANTNGYSSSESPNFSGSPYSIGAGESYFGSGAVDLNNAQVQTWLHANVVPEPASMLALGLGAVAMLRRKRK